MNAEKKSKNLLFGTTTSILVTLLSVLAWQFYVQKTETEKAENEVASLTLKDSLVYEFNVLKYEYKAITSQNQELNTEIRNKSEKITLLITEIEKLQNTNNDVKLADAYLKLQALKRENSDYTNTIVNLNRDKDILLAENSSLKESLSEEIAYTKSLEAKIPAGLVSKPALKEDVFAVTDFSVSPVKHNIERKEVLSKKASETDKIRFCFTADKNILIKEGKKTVFINVYSPSGALISRGSKEYKTEIGSSKYTLKSVFNYQNKPVEVCSYWTATATYLPGEYKSELIFESKVISSTTFTLK